MLKLCSCRLDICLPLEVSSLVLNDRLEVSRREQQTLLACQLCLWTFHRKQSLNKVSGIFLRALFLLKVFCQKLHQPAGASCPFAALTLLFYLFDDLILVLELEMELPHFLLQMHRKKLVRVRRILYHRRSLLFLPVFLWDKDVLFLYFLELIHE